MSDKFPESPEEMGARFARERELRPRETAEQMYRMLRSLDRGESSLPESQRREAQDVARFNQYNTWNGGGYKDMAGSQKPSPPGEPMPGGEGIIDIDGNRLIRDRLTGLSGYEQVMPVMQQLIAMGYSPAAVADFASRSAMRGTLNDHAYQQAANDIIRQQPVPGESPKMDAY